MSKLLEIIDLETNFYTYEGVVKALDKVSFSVDHGITFGLVGESGCGKSVTARSLMRIVQEPGRIEGGQVLFYPHQGNDRPTDLLTQSEAFMQKLRGNQISMIFQEPGTALNPIMNIGDQVAESFLFHRTSEMNKKILADLESPRYGPLWPLKKTQQTLFGLAARKPHSLALKLARKIPVLNLWEQQLKTEALRRSTEIIAKLGIPNPEEIITLYPHNLSGGMKQRIVIAIALACRPILLIADEPTTALDVTIQAQILALLNTLKQQEISSVLLITHDLGVVAETCDRVGVMYAGNLCEVADVKNLFKMPQHPYTRALLDSVPRFAQTDKLQSIEGSVPNLVTPPSGCRFHPRCPHAVSRCRAEFPATIEIEPNHRVACYLYTAEPRSKQTHDAKNTAT